MPALIQRNLLGVCFKIMNTYNITFNNGIKRTIYAHCHLLINTGNGIEAHWFILNAEVICTLVDVRSIIKEEND